MLHSLPRLLLICMATMVMAGTAAPLMAATVTIDVEGIEGEALKNVQQALALPAGVVQDGKVDMLWLEHVDRQAETKVREALEPFGYYRPTTTATLEGSEDEGYTIRVRIVPGEPVRLSRVTVSVRGPGADESPLKTLADSFPLGQGDVLLHQTYEAAKAALLSRAQGLGYLDASFTVHEIRVDPAAASARIELVLETGPGYRFGETAIVGAPLFPQEMLRRYITFTAGEAFSFDKLGKTQLNFTNSGLFKEVVVLPHTQQAADLRVPVEVRLTPAPRRNLRPGIGYGTDTGFRVSLSYRDLNIFYLGHQLNVEGTCAEHLQGIATGYTVPSPRNLETVSGVQLNLQREDVTDYLSTIAALEINRTHGFGNGRIGTVFLKFQYEEYTVGLENSSARLIMPGLRFSERRYDDLIRPTQGYHYSLEVRGAHRSLGSSMGFIQFLANAGMHVPLPWRLSLSARSRAGLTILDDPFGDLPASLRFFAGGDTSVRGYSYKSLGPKNAIGDVIGGKNLLEGSLELERALFESWGVSVFFDAGNAFDSFADYHLYEGAGLALHYYTRVGSVNVGLARQINVDNPGYRATFTIGFQL